SALRSAELTGCPSFFRYSMYLLAFSHSLDPKQPVADNGYRSTAAGGNRKHPEAAHRKVPFWSTCADATGRARSRVDLAKKAISPCSMRPLARASTGLTYGAPWMTIARSSALSLKPGSTHFMRKE
ncbi:hypothetical protein QFZ86_005275, partial [Pseudomonas plecoglossicida]